MRAAFLSWLLAAFAAPAVQAAPAQQPTPPEPEQLAFLELVAERDRGFVQEPLRLRLCFGVDEEFFRTSAIQLFQRPLDVPVQLEAPWLADLPGALVLEEAVDGAPGTETGPIRRTFALGGAAAEAVQLEDRIVAGRRFLVLEIERTVVPTAPGELRIPPAHLSFAYATRFDDDLLLGRVAADRHEARISAGPLALTILPLPGAGRPGGFSGAVGRFSVSADARPRELRVGESLQVVLTIEGSGHMGSFAAPRLDQLRGFHHYGFLEERGRARATITYELAPLRETVEAVPPIPFVFFDPTPPGGYRTVETAPIPIDVRPPAEGARILAAPEPPAADEPAAAGTDDLAGERAPRSPAERPVLSRTARALLVTSALALLVLLVALLARAFARRGQAPEPAARGRTSAEPLRLDPGERTADPERALAEFLATRLSCTPGAVIAPDLGARLARAGLPHELAGRTATLLQRLVAARYGGAPCDGAASTVHGLMGELERAFRAVERAR